MFLKIDKVRNIIENLNSNLNKFSKPLILNKNKKLRILHITNFNERHNGRLFFNTGRRINNGFIRLGHSVLEFRDIVSRTKLQRFIWI